ncbi:MAG: hypothetical protein ACOC7J_00565 [Armatimonadota bacterium]
MPASVLVFSSDVAGFSNVSLFAETSFLRWAMAGELATPQRAAFVAAVEFLNALQASSTVDVWTTPFVVEEVTYGLLSGRLRSRASRENIEWHDWASFKRSHSTLFERWMESEGAALTLEIRRFMHANGISVRLPEHRFWHREALGDQMTLFMSWLIASFHLEPADALHTACYYFDDADAIISTDLGFQRVDGIRGIAHRRADFLDEV